MTRIIHHSNGNQYQILDKSGDTVLLVEVVDHPKFVVAVGLDGNSWQGAGYYNSLHPALSRFLDIIERR